MKVQITHRDQEVFAAFEKLPLTAEQLLRFSASFDEPFHNKRIIERRLGMLTNAGFLRRFYFAFPKAGRNPSYWRLTSKSYRYLHPNSSVSKRSLLGKIRVSHHHHAFHVNEFVLRTLLLAKKKGVAVVDFAIEKALSINGNEIVVPDAEMTFLNGNNKRYQFFLELDTASERISTEQTLPSSIKKKLEFYERYRRQKGNCFRVLFVATSSQERVENILSFSRGMTNNQAAQMVYAAYFENLTNKGDWLTQPNFQNHILQPVALLPNPKGE